MSTRLWTFMQPEEVESELGILPPEQRPTKPPPVLEVDEEEQRKRDHAEGLNLTIGPSRGFIRW